MDDNSDAAGSGVALRGVCLATGRGRARRALTPPAKLPDMLAAPVAMISLACNTAAARAAVKSSRLTMPASQSISGEAYRISPNDVGGVICLPLPGGRRAMVVTVASGGTAGDIAWAAYVAEPRGWRLSLVRGGYKLGLVRKGGDVVATDPVYKANDPNCCPSGGFVHQQWHWNGKRFVVVRTWHDSAYQE
jgi:hypothetical protein